MVEEFKGFDWDPAKSQETYVNRHICFKCVEEIWKAATRASGVEIEEDPGHSFAEKRYRATIPIDPSSALFVAFTIR